MGVAQDFCTSLARCRIVMDSLKPESKRDDWLLLVKGRKAGTLFTTRKLIRKPDRADPAQGLMNNLNVDDDSALVSALLEIYTVKCNIVCFV